MNIEERFPRVSFSAFREEILYLILLCFKKKNNLLKPNAESNLRAPGQFLRSSLVLSTSFQAPPTHQLRTTLEYTWNQTNHAFTCRSEMWWNCV